MNIYKKYKVYIGGIISGLVFLSFVYAEAQTGVDSLLQAMVSSAQKCMNTPLKATYKEEVTVFYPKSYIVEYIGEDKARTAIKNVRILRDNPVTKELESTSPEYILPIDKESGLPYRTTGATVVHYFWQGKYCVEKDETIDNRIVKEIYIYDGEETKSFSYG